jgi:hypothetical protein
VLKLTISSVFSHIIGTVAKAFERANLIQKCFLSRDMLTLIPAFTVYARPLLEYASCFESPFQATAVQRVESLQRSFMTRLPDFASLTYKERLVKLNMDSLETRRLR